VRDPGTGAERLGASGGEHAAVALPVVVVQRSGQHPAHDLDVAMHVRVVAGARLQVLVVGCDQQPEPRTVRVVVVAERERVPRLATAHRGTEPVSGTPDDRRGCVRRHFRITP
jgi:hypothetical protein